MTPLLAITSAVTTFALSTFTLPPDVAIVTSDPSTVFADFSYMTWAAVTLPATTW